MKKSTLLSLATAGAIVATSVGTFAAWDQMDATSNGTVKLRNPVTVTATPMTTTTEVANYGGIPTYTSIATFTVVDAPDTGYELTSNVILKDGDAVVPASDVDVSVVDSNSNADVNGVHNLTVTITPADSESAKALAGKTLSVNVEGKVEAKASN